MRLNTKRIIGFVLVTFLLLISIHAPAQEKTQGDQTSGAKQELPVAAPDLADIVPMAVELTSRLSALENRIKGGPDISAVEKKYEGIEENLEGPAGQVQRLKDSEDYKYNKLVAVREAIKQENKSFEDTSKPISQEIRQLGAWREEWLAE